MAKEFWTLSEVIEIFEIKRQLLINLEEEEILCPRCSEDDGERLYSSEDMEILRITVLLIEELDVNLPGVDIILRMRRRMIDMRKQFDNILKDMADKMRERL
ncbi:MAG: chaperone modulator CbpM [Syntrophales bacterium]|nr:chaperone modulator CbpM [Syntrophales bacterium]